MNQVNKKAKSESSTGVTHTLKVSVPDSWQVVPLEEVLENIVGGGTPSRNNPSYWSGSIPWLTVKDMRTRRPEDSIDHISEQAVRDSATNIIPADTIIIATRIGLGKVIRVPYDAAINQDLKALITKPIVDKSYLEYWIYSIANYLELIGSGTTVKGIRLEQVRSLPFPLAPIDQQKRIVAEIEKQFSRLDEAIANLKRVKANLKRYKAAVLKAAVEGSLVETEAELARREGRSYETGEQLLQRILETRRSQWKGKGKYKEPAAPDTTDLLELPEGWVWATVEQLSYVDVGYAFKSNQFEAEGIRLLRGENIEPGRLRWEDTRYWPLEKVEGYRPLLIQEGEIILAMDRPIVTAGLKLARASHADLPCLLVQRMARMRCINREMEGYLYVAMQTQRFVRHLLGGQTGTQLPHISGSGIASFILPLPSMAEQHRIVTEVDRRLSLSCETDAQVGANLKRAECLRNSLLNCLFSGV